MTAPHHLLEKTRDAAKRRTTSRTASASDPPAMGEVFLHRGTAAYAVEWVVLDGDRAEVLVVPADASPLAGSGDLVARDKTGERRTLRCRFSERLASAVFDGQVRASVVRGEDVAEALVKQRKIARGERVGTFSERQVDDDPEYEDWVADVLEPACALLRALADDMVPPVTSEPAEDDTEVVPSTEPLRRGRGSWIPAAVAASVIAAVGSGGMVFLWQNGRLRSMEVAMEEQREVLTHLEERLESVGNLEARLAQANAEREQWAQTEEQLRGELAERNRLLAAAQEMVAGAGTVLNAVIAILDSGYRSGGLDVQLTPGASHVFFLLSLEKPDAYPSYRLELYRRDREEPVWETRDLVARDPGELRFGLLTSVLEPGSYRLRLTGRDGEAFVFVDEYKIQVLAAE